MARSDEARRQGQPASAFVQGLVEALSGDRSVTVKTLLVALQAMSAYVQKVRRDIAATEPELLRSEHIPAATDELEAVIEATAKATHAIMDATESIQTLAATLDAEPQQVLIAETMRIFEACTFQDITGQRVTKVVRALALIQERLDVLITSVGVVLEREAEADAAAPSAAEAGSDRHLLHGPQLPDRAKSQAEIDALFASL